MEGGRVMPCKCKCVLALSWMVYARAGMMQRVWDDSQQKKNEKGKHKVCFESNGICISHNHSIDVTRMVNCEFKVAKVKGASNELTCLGNVLL